MIKYLPSISIVLMTITKFNINKSRN